MPEEKPFHEPRRVVLSKIYTRTGDTGQTSLAGGQRIAKDGRRIDAYGTVDELNAFLGAARATAEKLAGQQPGLSALCPILKRVQHELFNLGSILATLPEDVHPRQARITEAEIVRLEQEIDEANVRSARGENGVSSPAYAVCQSPSRQRQRRTAAQLLQSYEPR